MHLAHILNRFKLLFYQRMSSHSYLSFQQGLTGGSIVRFFKYATTEPAHSGHSVPNFLWQEPEEAPSGVMPPAANPGQAACSEANSRSPVASTQPQSAAPRSEPSHCNLELI